MRKILVLAYSTILLAGCDCTPDPPPAVVEDLLVQIMTEGEWSITNFTQNSTVHTPEYGGWRFKFYDNKTVEAKFNTSVVYTGTWDGNANSMTFTANFPGAATPVDRIIGTWNVSASGSRIVDATMTVGTTVKVMKLYRE